MLEEADAAKQRLTLIGMQLIYSPFVLLYFSGGGGASTLKV